MMRGRKYLLILVSLTITGMPANAVPFVPDDAPRCNNSINRGAQSALDLHMTKLSNEEISRYDEYTMEKIRDVVSENPDKFLNARIWSKRYTDESERSTKRLNTLYSKLDELRRYAVKKYRCLLVLFYEQHKETRTKNWFDRRNLLDKPY